MNLIFGPANGTQERNVIFVFYNISYVVLGFVFNAYIFFLFIFNSLPALCIRFNLVLVTDGTYPGVLVLVRTNERQVYADKDVFVGQRAGGACGQQVRPGGRACRVDGTR